MEGQVGTHTHTSPLCQQRHFSMGEQNWTTRICVTLTPTLDKATRVVTAAVLWTPPLTRIPTNACFLVCFFSSQQPCWLWFWRCCVQVSGCSSVRQQSQCILVVIGLFCLGLKAKRTFLPFSPLARISEITAHSWPSFITHSCWETAKCSF